MQGHRPHLDGLRAIAVAFVVVAHSMPGRVGDLGGAGVGLFFGLSGYLITGLLLDEREREGATSLRNFYIRRAARLLPGLIVMVVVVNAILAARRYEIPTLSTIATLGYVSNYVTIALGHYIPVYGQTWSLAVEEHFYLLWPAALLWAVRRHGHRGGLTTALALCGVAFVWRIVIITAGLPPRLTYVDTFARGDALLYGCAAALLIRMGWRPRAWITWPAAAVVGIFVVTPSSSLRATVGQAIFAIAAAALVSGLDAGGPMCKLLSLPPLTWLGTISYGVYLWHLPLVETGILGPPGHHVIRAAIAAVGAATASYFLIERPARSAIRRAQASRNVNRTRTPKELSPQAALSAS